MINSKKLLSVLESKKTSRATMVKGWEDDLQKHCDQGPDRTKLLVHPSLLAQDDRMEVLGDLAGDVGRNDGIYGLWVLVPLNEQSPRPTLNHKAVPLSNPAQHVRLNHAWLANKH